MHPLSCLNFTLLCSTAQFTIMHQGMCIQLILPCKSSMCMTMHPSFNMYMSGITYLHTIIKHNCTIYLETMANSQSGLMLYCSLRILEVSCELVAIATATISNPTASVMCQEMSALCTSMSVPCSDNKVTCIQKLQMLA